MSLGGPRATALASSAEAATAPGDLQTLTSRISELETSNVSIRSDLAKLEQSVAQVSAWSNQTQQVFQRRIETLRGQQAAAAVAAAQPPVGTQVTAGEEATAAATTGGVGPLRAMALRFSGSPAAEPHRRRDQDLAQLGTEATQQGFPHERAANARSNLTNHVEV